MTDDIEVVREHTQAEKKEKNTRRTGGSCESSDVKFERTFAILNDGQLRGSEPHLPINLFLNCERIWK